MRQYNDDSDGSVRNNLRSETCPCTCGLCSSSWEMSGWWCDGADIAYLASGKRLKLGHGCRERIAVNLNVPPGLIGRKNSLLHIGRSRGKVFVPPVWTGVIHPRSITWLEEYVPVLPLEYYSDLVVDLMVRRIFIGADGSAFGINNKRPFPVVFHVRELKVGRVYALHGSIRLVFGSGYCSSSCLLDIDMLEYGPVWMSHEVVSVDHCSRCSRGIAHLQSRFRRRRAVT